MMQGFLSRVIAVLWRILSTRLRRGTKEATLRRSGSSAPPKPDAEHPDSIYPLW